MRKFTLFSKFTPSISTISVTGKTLRLEHLESRIALSAQPVFSEVSGYFDAPFNLQIDPPAEPGIAIHYTLDGSVPSATSPKYMNPISISTTTPVRAVEINSGQRDSFVTTQTYIFLDDVLAQDGTDYFDWNPPNFVFDPNVVAENTSTIKVALKSLPVVSLVLNPDDFISPLGFYTQPQSSATKRAVSVEMFDDSGVSHFSIDAGIKRTGNASLASSYGKYSFRLFFDAEFGYDDDFQSPKNLEAQLFGDDSADKFDKLNLRAGNQDAWSNDSETDVTYLRDRMVADLQSSLGGDAPRGTFVQVYINGLYWGVYNLHERPDHHFAEEYQGGDDDDYYARNSGGPITEISPGETDPWNTLVAELEISDNYEAISGLIDVPAFADYVIANTYSGMSDWEANWYATYNTSVGTKGKWYFHSWDSDRALSVDVGLATYPNSVGTIDTPIDIYDILLDEYEEFQIIYADRAQEHLYNGGGLSRVVVKDAWDALVSKIDQAIVGESARWGDGRIPAANRDPLDSYVTQTYADAWLPRVETLGETFTSGQREEIFDLLFERKGLSFSLDSLIFEVNGNPQHGGQVIPGLGTQLDILGTSPLSGNQTIYFTLDGSDPRLSDGSVSPAAIAYDGAGIPLFDTTYVRARLFTDDVEDTWSAILQATFTANAAAATNNLAITEVMYHPANPTNAEGVLGFTDQDDFEFIELRNTGTETVDLLGAAFTQGTRFTFSANTLFANASGREVNPLTLAPGEHIIVASNLDAFQARYATDIEDHDIRLAGEYVFYHRLSNRSERLRLVGVGGAVINDFTYYDKDLWPEEADGDGNSLEIVAINGDYSDPLNWQAGQQTNGTPGFYSGTGLQVESVKILSSAAGAYSYVIPDGPDQLKTVAVGGANQVAINFSESVSPLSVTAGDLALYNLTSGISLTPISVSFNGPDVIIWQFDDPLEKGVHQITIRDYSISSNADGSILDGEWTNPESISSTSIDISLFPSGNGTAGGNFEFLFTVLPGDFDFNNKVDFLDISLLSSNYNAFSTGGAQFDDGDFNGDGKVDFIDISGLSSNYGTNLNSDVLILADFDSDSTVNYRDLAIYLANRGSTNASQLQADANGDGEVDALDLDIIFHLWGLQQNLV